VTGGDGANLDDSLGFVHRFVPATNPAERATILLLHGTGGDENDLIPLGERVAPGAALLSPRGGVLENGAPRFFRRIAEGKFDPAEVRSRALELATFIRTALSHYGLDSSRVFALGFSNGANIASSVMFLEPDILSGAILLRPMVVFEPDGESDLSSRSVFIGAGRLDPIVPAEDPELLAEIFRRRGASVELSWQQSGHNLTPNDVREAVRWFQMQSPSGATSFSQSQ
jgi:phospholipase/carboxylesterase